MQEWCKVRNSRGLLGFRVWSGKQRSRFETTVLRLYSKSPPLGFKIWSGKKKSRFETTVLRL
jgi:hypothetical protein